MNALTAWETKHEMGSTDFKCGEVKAPLVPAGDGPVFIVRILVILVCNQGLFEITEWEPCM